MSHPRMVKAVVVLPGLALLLGHARANGEAHPRELFGSFTAEVSNPTFSVKSPGMLPSMGGMANPFSPMTAPMMAAERDKLAAQGRMSTDIASGMVEAFLHKKQLAPGELDCLVQGSGQVAGDLGVTASHTVGLLQQMMGIKKKSKTSTSDSDDEDDGAGANDIAAMAERMSRGTKSTTTTPKEEPVSAEKAKKAESSLGFFYGSRRLAMFNNPAAAMGGGAMMLELAFSGQQLIRMTHDIIQRCVQGDAREAFKLAAEHMRNLQYLEGRFMANGADIVVELSDAVMDFDNKNYRQFGQDVGKAMRKMLLSNSSNARLPEGIPDTLALANISAGLLRGFFGEGFAMDIKTPDSETPIHIDLHNCVKKNSNFFQSIWGSTMTLVARKEAIDGQDAFGKKEEAVELATMMAFTMMQLPTVMRRCNLGSEEEQMLLDSLKAMGAGTSLHMQTPHGKVSKEEVANTMAQTVKDWSSMDYNTFGRDLGKLMQKLTTTMFPKLYIVRDGRLRRQLELLEVSDAQETAGSSALIPIALMLTLVALLVALVVLKSRRTIAVWQKQCCSQSYESGQESLRGDLDLEVSRHYHDSEAADAVE